MSDGNSSSVGPDPIVVKLTGAMGHEKRGARRRLDA
jgi:hypothetical protein